MKNLRQVKGVLWLCIIVLLLAPSLARGQETYEPDQQNNWTWWDEFLCTLFFYNCGNAPCVGPCQTCVPRLYIGNVCDSVDNGWGSCRCVTNMDGTFTGCSLYGQACYGIIVRG